MQQPNPHRTQDSRGGFTRGDRVKPSALYLSTLPDGRSSLPTDGVVNTWATYEYGPEAWYCCVTFGGQYIGRYEAWQLEHDPEREPTDGDRRAVRMHRAEDRRRVRA